LLALKEKLEKGKSKKMDPKRKIKYLSKVGK